MPVAATADADECSILTGRAILAKSPNHPAGPVRRLMIEAMFMLLFIATSIRVMLAVLLAVV
jgi:hypothetical protein